MAGMSLSNSQDWNERPGCCQSAFLPAQSEKAKPTDLQISVKQKCETHRLTAEASVQAHG